jgi:hypothetical protein
MAKMFEKHEGGRKHKGRKKSRRHGRRGRR